MTLTGKVVVVTGAGRGIGAAYARLIAAQGAAVVIADVGSDISGAGSDAGPASTVAAAIVADGGEAVAVAADIRTDAGIASIRQAALSFGRGVHAVVNNAGVISHESFVEMTRADLQRQLDVHVFGTVGLTQVLWADLVASRGAVVTTISSALFGAAVSPAYAAAKGAVLGLTRSLAVLGAESGVRVNMVMPGAETRMQAFAREQFGGVAEATPEAARRSAPEQVAPLVAHLIGDACETSGEIFYAGHGWVRSVALAVGGGFHADEVTLTEVESRWGEVATDRGWTPVADLASFRDALGAPLRG